MFLPAFLYIFLPKKTTYNDKSVAEIAFIVHVDAMTDTQVLYGTIKVESLFLL